VNFSHAPETHDGPMSSTLLSRLAPRVECVRAPNSNTWRARCIAVATLSASADGALIDMNEPHPGPHLCDPRVEPIVDHCRIGRERRDRSLPGRQLPPAKINVAEPSPYRPVQMREERCRSARKCKKVQEKEGDRIGFQTGNDTTYLVLKSRDSMFQEPALTFNQVDCTRQPSGK
jgi:hypothetical protein